MTGFAGRLIAWHKRHGRHDLPWQATREPYAIWVSEIMLQQTQVATVIPYYRRFLERFPDISALAAAPLDDVLVQWSGLGYYSRARNLHRAAQAIVREHRGRFPVDFEGVLALPGIGRSTAAAICAFAFGARRAILDGNVKRVLTRHFAIRGYPGEKPVEAALWRKAESLLPKKHIAAYTQALMDLGAGLCTRRQPRCPVCPLVAECVAYKKGLTDQLPAPKSRRTLPRRKTVMLVLQHAGEVLLEKRPPTGIWGGLWCFPETAAGDDIDKICSERFGARLGAARCLPKLEHGFTHFRLTIEPRWAQVTRLRTRAAEPGHVWLPVEEASAAAVPTPVRRILATLSGSVLMVQGETERRSTKRQEKG
jgi:A/G-specific adenine glycosylase